MDDNKFKIQRIYYLMIGLKESLETSNTRYVDENTVLRYNKIVKELSEIIDENLEDYLFPTIEELTHNDLMLYKLNPLISYLKNMYIESSEYQIQKIGALYKAIEDKDLIKRCEDILLGEDAFDRAINQATQVLEDKIKVKAGLDDTPLTGLSLVSKAIHAKLDETILKISDEPDIQEGYSNLFKGMISIYRNPTHHRLSDEYSREYALKTCAFIDDLIKIVNKSQKIK